MSTPDPTTSDASPMSDPTSDPAPAPTGSRGLKITVVLLAALSLGLALVAGSLSATNRNTKGRTDAVRRASAAMGSALLSYDYRNLPKTKKLVLSLSTGTFKKQYTQAFDGGLDTVLKTSKAVSTVRDLEVFVSDVTARSATAIVVIDTTISGTAGKDRTLTSYVRLDLVHSTDGWLIDGVTNLNLGLPSGGTTSTTAPTAVSAPTTAP